MGKKSLKLVICIAIIFGIMGNAQAFAGAQEIKARMKARLPTILQMKQQGIIGENNQGFLAYLGTHTPNQDLVAAENKDRLAVYTIIARQTGTTPEIVGQRRAIQIAQTADTGDWLQDTDGKWYQKS